MMELVCTVVVGFPTPIAQLVAQYYSGIPFLGTHRIRASKTHAELAKGIDVCRVVMGPGGRVLVFGNDHEGLVMHMYDFLLEQQLASYRTPCVFSADNDLDQSLSTVWLSKRYVFWCWDIWRDCPATTFGAEPRQGGSLTSFSIEDKAKTFRPLAFKPLPLYGESMRCWGQSLAVADDETRAYAVVHDVNQAGWVLASHIWLFEPRTLRFEGYWTFGGHRIDCADCTSDGMLRVAVVECDRTGVDPASYSVWTINSTGCVISQLESCSLLFPSRPPDYLLNLVRIDEETLYAVFDVLNEGSVIHRRIGVIQQEVLGRGEAPDLTIMHYPHPLQMAPIKKVRTRRIPYVGPPGGVCHEWLSIVRGFEFGKSFCAAAGVLQQTRVDFSDHDEDHQQELYCTVTID
jgi:hypothetical protein